MAEHRAKRSRLSVGQVLMELVEEPMTAGSDDEFKDMACV